MQEGKFVMITAQPIIQAKQEINLPNPHHEHDDSIRIACQSLDAQTVKPLLKKKLSLSA